MSEPIRPRTPWVLWFFAMLLLAGVFVLSVLNETIGQDALFAPLVVGMILGYSTVGALLASRNPRNPIGWLMLTMAGAFVIGSFASEYAYYTYITNRGSLPGGLVAAWVLNWVYAVAVVCLPLLGLLFPTGRAPGPRWRWLVPATIAIGVLLVIGSILTYGTISDAPGGLIIVNPTGVRGFPEVVTGISWLALMGALAVSVAAVIVRYRRSTGEERQQIRWLAYVAITAVALVSLAVAGNILVGSESFGDSIAGQVFAFVGFALVGIGVPMAMGIAILKYRLYDLDVVIKKTVVFAILAALIAAALLAAILAVTTFATFAAPEETETAAVATAVFVVGILVWPLWRLSRRIADRLVYGGRSSPYEVLTQFSRRVGETYSAEDVLPRMAEVLSHATRARVARVWLGVGDGLRLEASSPRDEPPTRTSVPTRGDALPNLGDEHATGVYHQGQLVGALAVSMTAVDPMNPSKDKLVRDLAAQAGPVLRNVRLVEDLRESRRRIVTAQDERARRLERDIHDGAQQQLVALGVKMRLLEPLVERDAVKAVELLGQLQTETTEALENLRDLARGIYPPILADRGLTAALEAQSRKAVVPVRLEPDGVGRYPQEIESTVYFCVLEALQNVAKYARATDVTVRLRELNGDLMFEVRDDGVGFDPSADHRGTGLQGMADRMEAIGGRLEVQSTPGTGTIVRGRVDRRETPR
jgi:signal transduction histidine kinase